MASRRHTLALLGAAATAGLSGCLFGDTGGSDPPEPISNRVVDATGSIPQHQVDADNVGVLSASTPSGPTVTWRRTPNRYDAAQPVVDDDTVYVAFDGDVVKLPLADGEPDWTVDAGHASRSAPAVHDGVVYQTVWNGGESVPRGLVAIDEDSTERWRALTDNDVTAAPTPTDDAVFVGGGYETREVGAVDHDGTVRWRRDLGEYAAAPAVGAGRAFYATGESASVVALDTEDGGEIWERPVDGRAAAAPTLTGDSVVVADEAGSVRSLDVETGEERWLASVDGEVRHSVAVDAGGEAADDDTADEVDSSDGGGEVVVAHHGGVTTLSTAIGDDGHVDERWSVELDRDPTAPMVAGDAVLVGTGRDVVALARDDGRERWRFETRERSYTDVMLGDVTGSPVVVDGTVLAATEAGDVYALDDG